jgi:predicted nucleotide-binding protein (sugar kinase/HSP70/actin superfamily)
MTSPRLEPLMCQVSIMSEAVDVGIKDLVLISKYTFRVICLSPFSCMPSLLVKLSQMA